MARDACPVAVGAAGSKPPAMTLDEAARVLERAHMLAQRSSEDALGEVLGLAQWAARCGEVALTGRCHYLAARVSVNIGRLDQALALIDLAGAELDEAGCAIEAARTNLGRMHVLDDLGRHHDAIGVAERLLDWQPGPILDEDASVELLRLHAACHENIGVSNGYLGRHGEALDAYRAAESAYEEASLPAEAVRCVANRGVELIELGHARDAIEPLLTAGTQFLEDDDLLSAAKCAAYEARAQLVLGDYLAAIAALDRSEALLDGQETSTEYGRAQLVRAGVLASLNLTAEAEHLYGTLEARFAEAGLEHDRGLAMAGRASLLLRSARESRAAELFARAEQAFAGVGDAAMEAVCQVGRSWCTAGAGSVTLAEGARRTLAALGRVPDELAATLRLAMLTAPVDAGPLLERCEEILAGTDVPEMRWQVLHQRARTSAAAGDQRGALALLHDAADVIERLRTTVADDRGRVPFLGSRRVVHDETVRLLLELGDVAAAHAHTAGARARTLVELVERAGHATLPAPTPPTGPADPFAHTDVVVTYEIIGTEIMLFAASEGQLVVRRALASVDEVQRLVRRLGAQWRRFQDRSLVARREDALTTATVDVLRELFDVLLGPVPELARATSLVIVPVGLVADVPFHALHDGRGHLIERLSVGLAPSVPGGPRAATSARLGRPRRLVLGVADERAPHIADEVQAIAAASHRATVLLDEDATADALLADAAGHDIVHLACHGINRPDNPGLSALHLGDRWLTALEIADLELDGQLVVLSACESGRQHAMGNHDEMIGLPRAFLAAGASGVVVNLWPVDDEVASSFMTDFHARLDHSPLLAALRGTQRAMLAERPHPYWWAPTTAYLGTSQFLSLSTRRDQP